jgi:hypothetical protein
MGKRRIKMKLTNSQIYIYAQNLHKAFNDLT